MSHAGCHLSQLGTNLQEAVGLLDKDVASSLGIHCGRNKTCSQVSASLRFWPFYRDDRVGLSRGYETDLLHGRAHLEKPMSGLCT